jgi:hypothetical protein
MVPFDIKIVADVPNKKGPSISAIVMFIAVNVLELRI